MAVDKFGHEAPPPMIAALAPVIVELDQFKCAPVGAQVTLTYTFVKANEWQVEASNVTWEED